MTFRTLSPSEFPLIEPIFRAAIEAEESLVPARDASEDICMSYWFGDKPEGEVWVLEENGKILGSYYQRPNHYGLGGHIANGGYVVCPTARGKGVGRKLGEHSVVRAKERGYHGMQFNFVVSTNTVAVELWKSLGFGIIGTIPGGYHRKQRDYVDAYIMYQDLR
jgi:ribosomal protein S18 acetylase RimI-like enzyme